MVLPTVINESKLLSMKVVKRHNGLFPFTSLFDDLFLENRLDSTNYERFSIPAVNISENLSTFVVELAVPGLTKDEFEIEIEKESLKVSSNPSVKEDSAAKEETTFTRKEFNYGSFTRSFTLPDTVNKDEVKADYEAGVLRITLPKKEIAKDIKRMVEIS